MLHRNIHSVEERDDEISLRSDSDELSSLLLLDEELEFDCSSLIRLTAS
jgi:hypothetical protein